MILESHYKFLENDSSDWYAVELLAEYAGVILVYGTVSVKESPDKDQATLSFSYTIQDPGTFDHDELREDKAFNNYIGAILQNIILSSLDNNEAIIGSNKSDPNPYT